MIVYVRVACSRGSNTYFFFSSRRRHTRFDCDWSSDVCSSDLIRMQLIAVCHQLHPDIVITDIKMPKLDGIQATRCLRQERSEERRVGKECRCRWSSKY